MAEIKKIIAIYQKSIATMKQAGRITEEVYTILTNLANAMLYDRDAQELICELANIMHTVGGEADLIRECLLAKEFKTANLLAKECF